MNITLYKYLGERNKVDKSTELVHVLSTSGQFKAGTAVLSPSLILSLPSGQISAVTDEGGNVIDNIIVQASNENEVIDFNYFYIAEFRRYYYLTSIIVSSNNILVISGEVDPLFSFKDEILNNEAMIERNEFEYDEMQEDTLLPLALEKSVVESQPVENVNSATNTTFKSDFTIDERNIVVNVTMDSGNGSVISSLGDLPAINTDRFIDAGSNNLALLDRNAFMGLIQFLLNEYSALATFFKGAVAYPFDARDDSNNYDSDIAIYKGDGAGSYERVDTGVDGYLLRGSSKYRVVADFTFPIISSFLDLAPYAHYELYLPFYGWYELHANENLSGHRLQVYYSVNYADGSGEVYIRDASAERVLFSSPVQIGIALALSSSNAQELARQKEAMLNNLILGLVGSGVGLMGSAFSGNLIGAIGSGLSAVSNVTTYVNQKAQMFERVQSSHNGAMGALYSPLSVRMRVTKAKVRDNLNITAYAKQFGRPLRVTSILSRLKGFTQVASVHLHGVSATDMEKREIESSLLSGVIL